MRQGHVGHQACFTRFLGEDFDAALQTGISDWHWVAASRHIA